MNYAQLVELIQDYCETRETSFVANIPRFVRQAEQRIYRTVMIPELRKVATATVGAGSQYVARPPDFLSVLSFAVIDAFGRYHFLVDKDPSFIREAYPSPTTSGTPKYYAQFDGTAGGGGSAGNFILAPSPDGAYVAELQYYHDPESIVTAGTTWLGDNAETVLLYGALIEAYTYLKGDADLMTQYRQQYDAALMQLAGIDVRSKRDDYRDGQVRPGRS
jgi:hypothetical protein